MSKIASGEISLADLDISIMRSRMQLAMETTGSTSLHKAAKHYLLLVSRDKISPAVLKAAGFERRESNPDVWDRGNLVAVNQGTYKKPDFTFRLGMPGPYLEPQPKTVGDLHCVLLMTERSHGH